MNKYNNFYHKAIAYKMSKHSAKNYNQRTGRRFKRTFNLLDLKFCSNKIYMTHHTDNSYYYFHDQYKGRKYQFIHGMGILELRTDIYVKNFDDDPILGWHNKGSIMMNNNADNDEVVEKIIHLKMRFHDHECKDIDIDDLTEFIIESLNDNFQKDYITFEEV